MKLRRVVFLAVSVVLMACVSAMGEVVIDETNFPDEVFREYVRRYFDTDRDDVLNDDEIASVRRISVYSMEIASLEGIDNFTALTYLQCGGNQLTTLDVSNNTALTELQCGNNQLTALDVSRNTALTDLGCSYNQLTALDVSSNTALTYLSCGDNQLTNLDVSNNTALNDLSCWGNNLTTLDVSNNTALNDLYCVDNQLTTLDVSSNTALTDLDCRFNQLTTLDVSSNTALTDLACRDNNLTTLDVSSNTALTYLDCNYNQLTTLDVSSNTALTYLSCGDNQLTNLDVSSNTALTYLACRDNNLTTLDVSSNTALTNLWCHGNQLTALDLSRNTALVKLICSQNKLETLSIGSNTSLRYMYCDDNQLTTLDLSSNTALRYLFCENNKLKTLNLNGDTDLTSLICYGNQLEALDLSTNTILASLHCYDNHIAALDLSTNTALTSLACFTQLPTISLDETGRSDYPYSLRVTDLNAGVDFSRIRNLSVLDDGGEFNSFIYTDSETLFFSAIPSTITYEYDTGYPDTYMDVKVTVAGINPSDSGKVALTQENFPDTVFRDFLSRSGYDLNDDHYLSSEEIQLISRLEISGKGISDLTGIENFTNLLWLDCSGNRLTALDLSRNISLSSADCGGQNITLTNITSTGREDFPYSISLSTTNILSISAVDSSDAGVECNKDSQPDTIYFSARPARITYIYDTGYSEAEMDVTVTIPPDPKPVSDDIPSAVREKIVSLFGEQPLLFSDDEILSETWTLSSSDIQAITDLKESSLDYLPSVMPQNSGVYVHVLEFPAAKTGKEIKLYGITDDSGGGNVIPAALENMDYIFLDENGNEVTKVPENGIVYVAMRLTAGRAYRGVVTTPAGFIRPIEPGNEVLERIAEVINRSADEIKFITEENISEPKEATQSIVDTINQDRHEIIGTLDTLAVSEDGYYVFKVTLTDELYEQIRDVKITDLKAYVLYDNGQDGESNVSASIIDGLVSTWELLTLSGEKLEFGAKEFLMVGFLNAGTPFSVYLTKILLMLLAGGCETGLGLAALVTLCAFFFRRRQ